MEGWQKFKEFLTGWFREKMFLLHLLRYEFNPKIHRLFSEYQ